MAEREREIMQLEDSAERWENWMQFVQGQFVKKFTPHGFKLVKTPDFIHRKLMDAFNRGLANWDNLRSEGEVHVIYGPPAKFIDEWDVLNEVHRDLLPYHEEWAGGIKLKPTSIYGIRAYLNGSALAMHHDKVNASLS